MVPALLSVASLFSFSFSCCTSPHVSRMCALILDRHAELAKLTTSCVLSSRYGVLAQHVLYCASRPYLLTPPPPLCLCVCVLNSCCCYPACVLVPLHPAAMGVGVCVCVYSGLSSSILFSALVFAYGFRVSCWCWECVRVRGGAVVRRRTCHPVVCHPDGLHSGVW